MTRIKQTLLTGLAVLATVALSPSARALPQLQFSDGFSTVTVSDQGAGDLDANTGAIVYSGSIGTFTINVTTGITKPVLGSASQPMLDLNSIVVTGAAAGSLTIKFSDTDFITGGPSVDFGTAVGGVTAGSVAFDYFASTTNTNFAADVSIASSGSLSGPFVFSDMNTAALAGLYSLTTVATIVHTAGGQASSFNMTFEQVPEAPFAPSLLLGALLVAGRAAYRRRARRA